MYELILQIRNAILQRIQHIEATAKRLPEGSLSAQVSKNGTRLYWDHVIKENGVEIRKQTRLHDSDYAIAKGIQSRLIFAEELKALKINLHWAEKLLSHYQDSRESELVKKLNEPYRTLPGLDSSFYTKHQPAQSENPYYENKLVFENNIGERFRSKSEMHIAELLMQMDIPYRYEKKLTVGNDYKYPDFTIKRPDASYAYIEYFGMIEKEDYQDRMFKTLNWYLDHKLIPGRDVLFLFENAASGINLPVISKQIHDFIVFYE